MEDDADLTELTDKVTVATNAQKKLRHIVLMLNTLLISCGIDFNPHLTAE